MGFNDSAFKGHADSSVVNPTPNDNNLFFHLCALLNYVSYENCLLTFFMQINDYSSVSSATTNSQQIFEKNRDNIEQMKFLTNTDVKFKRLDRVCVPSMSLKVLTLLAYNVASNQLLKHGF